jgi:hypothetical protein
MSKVLVVKVKEKGSKESSSLYKNKVSLENPSLISLIFEDLEDMFGAPIRKACQQYLAKKKFPFSP